MTKDAQNRKDVSSYGEFGLISHLTKNINNQNSSTVFGVGDDAAVIDQPGEHYQLISTDLLLEGIHFDLMYSPLKHLGYKAVIVNLSDIYAMNGTPEQILFSFGISNRFSVQALEELYKGIELACEIYGVDLVGGDTASSKQGLVISVSAIGRVVKERIVYRHTAKEGDLVCSTGDFGAAYCGLQFLEREKQIYIDSPKVQPELEDQVYVLGRQLKPEARRDTIKLLDSYNILPTAMIDVSDGLSSDITHICKRSRVGVRLYEENIPISREAYEAALQFNMDPITCALNGGEDYELLFTISPEDRPKLEQILSDISVIGNITAESEGMKLFTKGGNSYDLLAQGWKHLQD